MEAHGDMSIYAENFDPDMLARLREDENNSRSGSDNNGTGASGDDRRQELAAGGKGGRPARRQGYHRHSQRQTRILESFFKECPHPDEHQRLDLSRRLGLDPRQIKFWFQNRRTQMKTQLERHENIILRQENDRLRAENILMKESLNNPTCNTCGGLAMPGSVSVDDHHLKVDNARLREELNRVSSLANKFFGRSLSCFATPLQIPEPDVAGNPNPNDVGNSAVQLGLGIENNDLGSSSPGLSASKSPSSWMRSDERSVLLDIAFNAMDELMRLAQASSPLWIKTMDGEKELLNQDEYLRSFNSCFGLTPPGYVTEATRDVGAAIINGAALVEIMTEPNRWMEMFKDMIAAAAIVDIVSEGINGSKNGAVTLMHADLQVLSPLIPIRRSRFLRFSKQHAPGFWAVVDISLDSGNPFPNCRRLPSGILVQDMPNGYSKVIWIEHSEYDERVIHQLYEPLVSSGLAFGAKKCIATLQRQCESFALLMSTPHPTDESSANILAGKATIWNLAQRMTENFCSGICATGPHLWEKIPLENMDDMRLMVRRNVADVDQPANASVLLTAATSVWLPVSRHTLFSFLRSEHLRPVWDNLTDDAPMQEIIHIAKGQAYGNAVSLLRSSAVDGNGSSTLVLQESWTDASSSLIVYAPIDMQTMYTVLNGGESSSVPLLPSGFAIHPDAQSIYGNGGLNGGGSLLTIGIHIQVHDVGAAKLTDETVESCNTIIQGMIQKIKDSLQV